MTILNYITTISALKALIVWPIQIAVELLTRWALVAMVALVGARLGGDDFILYTLLIATVWGLSRPNPPVNSPFGY